MYKYQSNEIKKKQKQKEKEKLIKANIKNAIARWQQEKSVAEYVRNNYLTQEDEKTGKIKIDNILDSVYNVAVAGDQDSDKIRASESIMKLATLDQNKQDTNSNNINIFASIAENSNKTISKLVDVTNSNKNNKKNYLDDLV